MTAHYPNLKALIVDDNQFMNSLAKNILKKLEIAPVLEARDGATALQLLDGAAVDVVVCDLNMPEMDGIEFLRHLAQRDNCPAVILSSGEGHIRACWTAGEPGRTRLTVSEARISDDDSAVRPSILPRC